MNRFQQDLTNGNVIKQLINFSLPFLLSNFLQALYNVADMLIVSWFSGAQSVSGVSNGGQVTLVVTNFVIGLTIGGAVMIGQYFGAKKYDEMHSTIGTMLSVLVLLGAFLTGAMILLCEPVLHLLAVPADAFQSAKEYLNICMGGTIFIFGYNAISAILRGMGDSKRPLFFVALACFVNIGLDLLLVGTFKMGAAGAAIATVLAQALSLIISVVYLVKNKFVFDFKLRSFRIDWTKLVRLFKIGFPTSIQNIVVGLSFLVVTGIANQFGVDASAAVGIGSKFNGFAILPALAVSMSVSSMAAQNFGAGLPDRAKKTMYSGMLVALPLCILFFVISFFFPEVVMGIFTNEAPVILAGVAYLRYISIDFLLVSFTFSMGGLLIGAGHTLVPMLSAMLSSLALRAPLALLFAHTFNMGLQGIGLAMPAATIGGMLCNFLYLQSKHWKRSGINKKKPEPTPELSAEGCTQNT